MFYLEFWRFVGQAQTNFLSLIIYFSSALAMWRVPFSMYSATPPFVEGMSKFYDYFFVKGEILNIR